MELIYDVLVVWLMSSVALGVGSASVAITSFLTAIYDGTLDSSERSMLKVIYWALRWAMVTIALILALLQWGWPHALTSEGYLWTLIVVLYINAALMTKHIMSTSIGPAIQAASWYTMGFLLTIELFNLSPIDLKLFGLLYAGDIIFFALIVNGGLWWIRRKNVQ